jgi:hypothetical protein
MSSSILRWVSIQEIQSARRHPRNSSTRRECRCLRVSRSKCSDESMSWRDLGYVHLVSGAAVRRIKPTTRLFESIMTQPETRQSCLVGNSAMCSEAHVKRVPWLIRPSFENHSMFAYTMAISICHSPSTEQKLPVAVPQLSPLYRPNLA